MADEYTKNLSLKKPAYESAADIRDINANMDKLDETVGRLINGGGGGSGGSETADRLATPRQISLSGDASGSAMFDGSSDIDIKVTIPSLSEEELLELLQGSSGGGGGGGSGGSGGIGTVTATVDDTSGNPQVKVTQSGSDFRLDFTGINGAKGADGAPGKDGQPGPAGSNGQDGAAAGFGEITATVDDGVGEPYVEVSATGPDTQKNLQINFHNLKGKDGAGSISEMNIASVDGVASLNASENVNISCPFNHTFSKPPKVFCLATYHAGDVQGYVDPIPTEITESGCTVTAHNVTNENGEIHFACVIFSNEQIEEE